MMGRQTDQKELFSYSVDLDKRVRQDNPLRAVDSRIDNEPEHGSYKMTRALRGPF